MISHCFFALRYEDYILMEPTIAKQVLEGFIFVLRRRIYGYGDVWQRDPGVGMQSCNLYRARQQQKSENRILKLDCLEPLLYGYALQISEVERDFMLELVNFYVETQDHDRIKWGVYSLATGINRHGLLHAGLEALCDFIGYIQNSGYLEQLNEQIYKDLWDKWSEDLFKYAGKYRGKLPELLPMLDERQILIADSFRARLQAINWQDDVFEFHMIESINRLLSKAIQDINLNFFIRQVVVCCLFESSLEAKSVEQVMVNLMIQIVNMIYPEEKLFG